MSKTFCTRHVLRDNPILDVIYVNCYPMISVKGILKNENLKVFFH